LLAEKTDVIVISNLRWSTVMEQRLGSIRHHAVAERPLSIQDCGKIWLKIDKVNIPESCILSVPAPL
jgi:hypothetical protein